MCQEAESDPSQRSTLRLAQTTLAKFSRRISFRNLVAIAVDQFANGYSDRHETGLTVSLLI
jgi:hypothetical protein